MSSYTLSTSMQNSNALRACKQNRMYDDREYVLGLVRLNGESLKDVTPELRDDSEVVLTAIEHTGIAAQYASSRLKGDASFMMQAFMRDHRSLRYATPALRNDGEFMYQAMSVSSTAFVLLSDELKQDRQFMTAAINKCAHKDLLGHVSIKLRADYEFVLLCVSMNGLALEHAAEKLKDDKDLVLAAVRQNGMALKFASRRAKCDREVVITAVSQNAMAQTYVPPELRKDRAIVLSANRARVRGRGSASTRCSTAPAVSDHVPSGADFRENSRPATSSGGSKSRRTSSRKSLMSNVLRKSSFSRAMAMQTEENHNNEPELSTGSNKPQLQSLKDVLGDGVSGKLAGVDSSEYSALAENQLTPDCSGIRLNAKSCWRAPDQQSQSFEVVGGNPALTPAARKFVKQQALLALQGRATQSRSSSNPGVSRSSSNLSMILHDQTSLASKKPVAEFSSTPSGFPASNFRPGLVAGAASATPGTSGRSTLVRPQTR